MSKKNFQQGKDKMKSLADELKRQKKAVAKKATARDCVGLLLEVIVERVQPIDLFSGIGNLKHEDMMPLINDEMERVTEGCLRVPHYNPGQKAQQEVFLYVGTHWCRLENEKFYEMVKECCRRMGMPRGKLSRAGLMAEVYHNVMAHIAKCWNSERPEGEAWLNLQNGTLVVDAEGVPKLREHRREDCLFNCLPFSYDAQAESPLWLKFLDRVLPDADCQKVLQEFVANALVGGAVNLQYMLLLMGGGSNGKSVLLEVLSALAGAENVSNMSLSELTDDPNAMLRFEHKLLNLSSESDRKWGVSTMKRLTSHEPVTVKELYQNKRETTSYGYLIAAVNELPRAESTDAFFRRLKILPFNVIISDEEADPDLVNKLKQQLPGILNWFLEGLPGLLQRQHLSACKVCDAELQTYREQTDNVFLFVRECCRSGGEVMGSVLYKRFQDFCADNGQRFYDKLPRFYARLRSLNVDSFMKDHQVAFALTLL